VKNEKITANKLLKIFKLLNKEETRRFKKLLQSPFFTTNTHLLRLYDYLIKYYPDFNDPKLTKTLIFTYLFPDRAYNDNKLRMLLRAFTRQLEDFLVIKEVQTNDKERKKHLINSYGKRNEMELFKKGTFGLLEEMKTLPIKNKYHFFEKQQLLQNLIYHPATPKTAAIIDLQTEMMEHLELHYWANKTWMSCNLLSTQQFLNVDLHDLELSINNLPSKYLSKYAPLATFYKAFLFLKSPSESHYFQLKTAYLNSLEELGKSDKRDLYSYLANYAVRQYNQGNLIFLKEIFKWNNIGLNYNLLLESGMIDKSVFKNCCLIAIRLNYFNWVEKFMKDYQDSLNQNNKQDTITLCQGYLHFYKKNYAKLIDKILPYKFHQFRDNLGAKGLLLRSYFELFLLDNSYVEILMAYSNSFEKFLRRNESAAKNVIKEYLCFILILRKVTKLIHERKWNTHYQKKISAEVLKEKMVMKQWLLDAIQFLNFDFFHNNNSTKHIL